MPPRLRLPFRLPSPLRAYIRSCSPSSIFLLTFLYTTTPLLYLTRNHMCIYKVSGPSMSPFLSPDYDTTGAEDIVFVRKNIQLSDDPVSEGGTGSKGELERGMVVVFWRMRVWGKDKGNVEPAVKRVVALEGDEVVPLVRRRVYDTGGRSIPHSDEAHPPAVKIPYGHVWLEGVNSEDTVDSTEYGPISKSLIAGIATRIVWPPSRRGVISWERSWEASEVRERVKVRVEREWEGVPEEWAM